ncbi:MAG TPA: hypothetical protein VFD27_20335, partial [Chthoniobacteraceae bacterium]|nr:hypothetical protein [Chthoniobacteraceae bacterium]
MGAFKRLRAHENLVTVRQCKDEALSGIPGSAGRIIITPADLGSPLSVVEVSNSERVHLALIHPESATLDNGERDLLAHAFARSRSVADGSASAMAAALRKAKLPAKDPDSEFQIVSADRAAVRVAILMGFGDVVVSLEEVLDSAGVSVSGKLKSHYTRRVLSDW